MLSDLVGQFGEHATADTAEQAAASCDLVVVTIPLKAYRQVPAAGLAGKTVIDTNNYYPQRDGQIPELDDDSTTSSELLASHLDGAHVVKAFNTIHFKDLASQGQPAGTHDRRALPTAGDDAEAKRAVDGLIREFGFDVVDVGPLAAGRRFQPGTPAYNVRLNEAELRAALGMVTHTAG